MSKGIECPRCGCCDCRVTNTVRHVNMRSRRRRCRNCGHGFTTREKTVGGDRISGSKEEEQDLRT